MILDEILAIIQPIVLVLLAVWLFAFGFLDNRQNAAWRLLRRTFFNLRPFIPAIAITHFLCGAVRFGTDDIGFRTGFLIFMLVIWWLSRFEDDDEDKWKKRREAVNSRVAVMFGRLRIVPA